jgi:hypothetical protein
MAWDQQRKLDYLLRLPWTISPELTPEGDRLLRVRELPSVIASGDSDEEIERDFWDSLETTLRSYLHFGDDIPLPEGLTPPWKQAAPVPAAPRRRAFLVVNDQTQGIDPPDTASVERWEEERFDRSAKV